jgi:hypothetical protein
LARRAERRSSSEQAQPATSPTGEVDGPVRPPSVWGTPGASRLAADHHSRLCCGRRGGIGPSPFWSARSAGEASDLFLPPQYRPLRMLDDSRAFAEQISASDHLARHAVARQLVVIQAIRRASWRPSSCW